MRYLWLLTASLGAILAEDGVNKRILDATPFHHSDYHTGGFGVRPGGNHSRNEKRRQGGTLPTIFIIGAQKGGSSSLWELMVEHPQLCMGIHKENHFFDHLGNYAEGTQYFRQMYSDPKCDKVPGTHFIDGTPILHYPSTWQRIYDTYSESPIIRDSLKFIVLLREPVSRDFSWYQHVTRTGQSNGFSAQMLYIVVSS